MPVVPPQCPSLLKSGERDSRGGRVGELPKGAAKTKRREDRTPKFDSNVRGLYKRSEED